MAQFVNMFDVDLQKPTAPQPLRATVGEGDANGLRVGARVASNGQYIALGGSCVGKVIRADGATVQLTGTISGNQAYVVLDQTSCAVEGPIQVAVCWVSGSNVTTLLVAYGTIVNTQTGNAIQPSTPIPDLTELLAEIDAMETATAAANAAAANALGNFAGAFSDAANYAIGEYVTYSDGYLYQFKAYHAAGAWNASHVNKVTVGTSINALRNDVGQKLFTVLSDDNINAFLKADGTVTANDIYRTTPTGVRLNAGQSIKYNLRIRSDSLPILCVYSDAGCKTLTDSVLGRDGKFVEGVYTAASDCYVRFTYHVGSNPNYDVIEQNYVVFVDDVPDNVRQNIVETIDTSVGRRLFSVLASDNIEGFLQADGTVTANEIYRTTPAGVRLDIGQKVKYNLRIRSSSFPVLCVYSDADCTTLIDSVLGADGSFVSGTYTAASSCYIRFCYHVGSDPNYDIINQNYAIFDEDIPDNVRMEIQSLRLPDSNIKCAIFGDSIFGNDGEIIDYLNANSDFDVVYNCAIGGTCVSNRTDTTSPYYWLDGLNLWTAITTNTYTNQDAIISGMSATIQTRYATIKSVNYANLDLIVLAYGTNDYTKGKGISDITTAYNSIIHMIRSSFPKVRILVLTPIWRLMSYDSTQAAYVDSDEKTYAAGVTLRQIADGIIANCKSQRVTVFDGYSNVEVALETVPTYFDVEAGGIEVPPNSGNYYSGVHLNSNGNRMYAHYVHGAIMNMF